MNTHAVLPLPSPPLPPRKLLQREQVVDSFREGKIWFLIATDLMGRGMDIVGVNVVVNYDCPQTTAAYIHRIGALGKDALLLYRVRWRVE
ncbi:unnamed protein product [Closterium sp. NIES-53]